MNMEWKIFSFFFKQKRAEIDPFIVKNKTKYLYRVFLKRYNYISLAVGILFVLDRDQRCHQKKIVMPINYIKI